MWRKRWLPQHVRLLQLYLSHRVLWGWKSLYRSVDRIYSIKRRTRKKPSSIKTPHPITCSLRSRRLEVVGERENGRARGRHARGVSFSRASFSLSPLLPSACYAGYITWEECSVYSRIIRKNLVQLAIYSIQVQLLVYLNKKRNIGTFNIFLFHVIHACTNDLS